MTTIAIIGAGFCGSMLAMHWLRSPPVRPLRLLLINRSGAMARGVAYGTPTLDHLLNVPAGRMSAIETNVDDFYRYAHEREPRYTRASFVPRNIYGDYLEARLTEAIEQAPDGVVFDSVVGTVVAISSPDDERLAAITMDNGQVIHADRIVLSNGNEMRGDPPVLPAQRDFYVSSRYVRDPWRPGALRDIERDASVLLVGSGLDGRCGARSARMRAYGADSCRLASWAVATGTSRDGCAAELRWPTSGPHARARRRALLHAGGARGGS